MTFNRDQARAVRKVKATRFQIDEAAAAHHDAIVQALSLGVRQTDLAEALGVSRQAVSEYVNRWITKKGARRPTGRDQGTLF